MISVNHEDNEGVLHANFNNPADATNNLTDNDNVFGSEGSYIQLKSKFNDSTNGSADDIDNDVKIHALAKGIGFFTNRNSQTSNQNNPK